MLPGTHRSRWSIPVALAHTRGTEAPEALPPRMARPTASMAGKLRDRQADTTNKFAGVDSRQNKSIVGRINSPMEELLRKIISAFDTHHGSPTWLSPLVGEAQQLLRGPAPERPYIVVPEAEEDFPPDE